ncbi:xanthine dehydrogenase family protein subunit M [Pigmentiphaga sp. YJ18]|uniref:FAD binding domain-containing protein n=1 Tax=Pigmentiphaga sp. YJ18 TaxID=3134907 RepID=UPI00310E2C7F
MKFCDFEYVSPGSVEEAIGLLAANPGEAKLIAGGQSLLPTMAYRLARPSMLVDLRHLDSLRGITVGPEGVRLGALTRWRDIEADGRLAAAHPLLQEAVRHVAHYQIRNRGTVGGSLAHGDPASEFPGVAVCCGATIEVRGEAGSREIPAGAFHVGPLSTVLADDELILAIRFPPWQPDARWAFREFSLRDGDFAPAGVMLCYRMEEGVMHAPRIGVIGACAQPMRLPGVEACLDGREPGARVFQEAARLAALEVEPPDDLHADAGYRRALLGTLTLRALHDAARRAVPA